MGLDLALIWPHLSIDHRTHPLSRAASRARARPHPTASRKMPAMRSASRAEVSEDDLLSGSDGNEVSPPPPKKAARATPAGRGKGSSSASGGAKTVAAPARRPAPATTPAFPLVDDDDDDDDDDDLSQGGSSGMLNIDLVATLQGTLQRQVSAT